MRISLEKRGHSASFVTQGSGMIPLRAIKATADWAGHLQEKAAGQGL
jgi:hypothetical protein